MIKTLLRRASGQVSEGGVEQIDTWLATEDACIWVLLAEEASDSEAKILRDVFEAHPLAIADIQRSRHPPKIEEFDAHTLLMLKGLDDFSTESHFRTMQVSMLVGDRYLVTRCGTRSVSTEALFDRLAASRELPSPDELALAVVRVLGERFLAVLLRTENRVEVMEDEMIEAPSDRLLADLVRQKSDLKRMVRVLTYHAGVFAETKAAQHERFDRLVHELNDVKEHVERQLSLARLQLELSDDLINGYLSLSAHRLNQIMKTLTIVTVIFVPITFMAGIYGMNFEFIPELGLRHGYFALLTAMFVVVASILVVFFRRGWLGRGGS